MIHIMYHKSSSHVQVVDTTKQKKATFTVISWLCFSLLY